MTATALLLIDLQHAFAMRTAAGVPRSNPGAEAAIARLSRRPAGRSAAALRRALAGRAGVFQNRIIRFQRHRVIHRIAGHRDHAADRGRGRD